MKLLLLFGVSSVIGFREDRLDLHHLQPDQFSRVHTLQRPKRSSRTRRSSSSSVLREKREESDNSNFNECSNFDTSNFKTEVLNEFSITNDTNPSISLVWTGDNGHILAVTTYESFVAYPSKLYLSKDGGRNFEDITDRIAHEYIRRKRGALTATADSSHVILIVNNHPLGFGETSDIYVSEDEGVSWTRRETPFELSGSQMKFHPEKSSHILATDATTQQLFITTDFCKTWRSVHDSGKTSAFKWDPKNADIFYYTHDPVGSGRRDRFSMTLYRSKDDGKTSEALTEHVWSFGIQEQFLFVSVRYMAEGDDDVRRIMHVSSDHGDNFRAVQLPAISSEQFYSILDASENMIFMHVDDEGDTGKGAVYVSDSSGTVFSKSLSNNLYPNGDDVTDFVKVDSMNGVYLTSILKDDKGIESRITYDKGATWDPLTTPLNCEDGTKCGCDKEDNSFCNLQVHCAFSAVKGVSVPEMPYSTNYAPGLIFGHGNVGDGLSTDEPDLYASSDGGYSWIQTLKGPHKTLIGDSGSVVWAVTNDEQIDTIKFSFNEGQCWNSFKFSDKKIDITGLVAEPGEKSTDVAIWGWDDEKESWVVFTFDFGKVLGKACSESDYENWEAHEDLKLKNNKSEEGCQLGKKTTYKKLKKESICFNGKNYEPAKTDKKCKCTAFDFLCDFGYYRKDPDSPDCVPDPDFKSSGHRDICIGENEEEIVSKGYLKIPGDECDESQLSEAEKQKYHHTELKLKTKCPKQQEVPEDYGMKDSLSWRDYYDIDELDPAKMEEGSSSKSGHAGWTFFSIVVIAALSGVAFHFYRKSENASSVVSYQNFTNDDVPALDSAVAQNSSAAAGEFRDDSSDEDNDMITA